MTEPLLGPHCHRRHVKSGGETRRIRLLQDRAADIVATLRGRGDEVRDHELAERARAAIHAAHHVHKSAPTDSAPSKDLASRLKAAARAVERRSRGRQGGRADVTGADIGDAREVMSQLMTECRTAADEREAADVNERKRAIAEWCRLAEANGAGMAHRWAQVPAGWRPETADLHVGDVVTKTSDPAALVAAEACKWRPLWAPPGQAAGLPDWGRPPRLPRPTVAEVRGASKRFKRTTGQSADRVNPRDIGDLGDEVIDILIELMTCCELLGAIPEVVALVVVVLIAKKAGGRRPVGLLPALYRLWAKVRQPHVRRWEAEWERRYFAAGRGRSACDIAWLRALRAEYASSVGATAASVLWDLRKCFEHGSHTLLAQEAKELSFPLAIARLAVAMYGTERRLTLDGAFSEPIKPSRGFIAGCANALAAIKATMIRRMDSFVARNPDCDVDMFVDDAELQSVGTGDSVTKALIVAAVDLSNVLERELGYPLADEKAVIIDNDGSTAQRIADGTDGRAGKPCTVTNKLGVEFTCGRPRPRRGGPRRARYAKQMARRRRIGRLRRLGCRVAQVVTRGARPAATYGAPVHGVSDSELNQLSALTAFATSPSTRGTSRTLKLLIADDPAVAANAAVLSQWAAAVWRACGPSQRRKRTDPTPLLMNAALTKAEKQMADNGYAWSAVTGPASAAVLTARRIGWKHLSGFRIQDERGSLLDMAVTDPRGITAAVERATRVAAEVRAGRKEGLATGQGVWTSPVRRALNSTKLTPMAKASLRRAFTGGYWTSARRMEHGLSADARCPLCGAAVDDIFHRMWECLELHDCRHRYTTERMRDAAAEAGRSSLRWTRAVAAEPRGVMAAPRRDHGETWVFAPGVPHERWLAGDVYTDGSATNPRHPEVRRAGWAAIQVDDQGELIKGVYGHVPAEASTEQTAGAGELYALRRAAELAAGDTVIHTDYQTIIDGVKAGEAACCHHRKPSASAWRAYWRAAEGGNCAVYKVKAHRTRAEAMGDDDPRAFTQWKANRTADIHAKLGAKLHHGLGGRAAADAYEAEHDELAMLAKWIGISLSRWPRAAGGNGRRAREARAKAAATRRARRRRAAASYGHRLALGRDGWRCLTCGKGAGTEGGTRRLASTACQGHIAARVGNQGGEGAQHILWAAESERSQPGELGADLVWCARCGAYSATKVYRLAHACRGFPEKSARTRLRAINSGRHPTTGRRLAPPVRVTDAVLDALNCSAAERRAAFDNLLRGAPRGDLGDAGETHADKLMDDGEGEPVDFDEPAVDNGDGDGDAEERRDDLSVSPPAKRARCAIGWDLIGDEAEADAGSNRDPAYESEEDVFGHGGDLGHGRADSGGGGAKRQELGPPEDDLAERGPAEADVDGQRAVRRRIGSETTFINEDASGSKAERGNEPMTSREPARARCTSHAGHGARQPNEPKRIRLTCHAADGNSADGQRRQSRSPSRAAASSWQGRHPAHAHAASPHASESSGDRHHDGREGQPRLSEPESQCPSDARELKRRRIRGKRPPLPPSPRSGLRAASWPAPSQSVDLADGSMVP